MVGCGPISPICSNKSSVLKEAHYQRLTEFWANHLFWNHSTMSIGQLWNLLEKAGQEECFFEKQIPYIGYRITGLLQQKNARPHTSGNKVRELEGIKLLIHPLYSADFAPSHHNMFRSMATAFSGRALLSGWRSAPGLSRPFCFKIKRLISKWHCSTFKKTERKQNVL